MLKPKCVLLPTSYSYTQYAQQYLNQLSMLMIFLVGSNTKQNMTKPESQVILAN